MTYAEAAEELQKLLEAWEQRKSCSIDPEAVKTALRALRREKK